MSGELVRGRYVISTDPSRLDVERIHAFLSRSYWSPGIPRSVLERGISHCLCFGVYLDAAVAENSEDAGQVGFARVITDRATFAYLADVFILPPHRGRGLGKWLIETIRGHQDLRAVRRFLLATRDAHSLYRQFGFAPVAAPDRLMEILKPDPYGAGASQSLASD
jgi:GNAT superfamily N-acetyltransferase